MGPVMVLRPRMAGVRWEKAHRGSESMRAVRDMGLRLIAPWDILWCVNLI